MTTKRLVTDGILVTVALILSYVETLIPLPVPVPGIKIGLANLATVFALYRTGTGDAAVIALLRVALAALLFGTFFSFFYSLSGAAVSFAVMALLKRTDRFKAMSVSVSGGVCHNIGQILAAILILGTPAVLSYLPVLLISGTVSGAVIGLLAGVLVKRVRYVV